MYTRPHFSKIKTRLEAFNDVILMFMIYHMITFSNFNTDLESKFVMGYSQVSFLALLIFVNLVYLIVIQALQIIRNRRNKMLKNIYCKRLKEENYVNKLKIGELLEKVKDNTKNGYIGKRITKI
jgi:hypothetical protein